jgi:tetratricopeptide (TPR) repeat protein
MLADLNNEGAFQLENGHYSEAISTLTSALNLAMSEAGNAVPKNLPGFNASEFGGSQSSHHRHSHRSADSEKTTSKPRRRRRVAPPAAASATNPAVSVTEDIKREKNHFVYSTPIRVTDRYALPSTVELSLYAIYNLALSYHLRALTKRRKKSGGWRKVLKLYTLANAMQVRDESIGLAPTFTIALWNNLSQAYWSIGKDEASDDCFQTMLSNVNCMIDHGCVREVENIDYFLESASHLLSPLLTVAEAA